MSLSIWLAFFAIIIVLLALDLGVFHRRPHAISTKEALGWSVFWVALAMLFNGVLYLVYEHNWAGLDSSHMLSGKKAATLFFTAYIVEKTLSIDNIFVIAMVFAFFKIPLQFQHRLLFWGVFGAIFFRGIMIFAGVTLVKEFSWLIYVLGALLIITAIKMLVLRHDNLDPNRTWIVKLIRKLMPVSEDTSEGKFFIKVNNQWAITSMGIALLLVESFDLLFAVDSIPAVMAITLDPFIIFTSNVFAILGLRSLYFALAGMMDRFRYLKTSLAFVLAFVGIKMLVSHHYPIPPMLSLLFIFGILGVGVLASLSAKRTDSAPLESPFCDKEEFERVTRTTVKTVRRFFILLVGSTVLIIGTALLVLPGPGVLVLFVGLTILATEFVWAKLWLAKIRLKMEQIEDKAKKAFKKKAKV